MGFALALASISSLEELKELKVSEIEKQTYFYQYSIVEYKYMQECYVLLQITSE